MKGLQSSQVMTFPVVQHDPKTGQPATEGLLQKAEFLLPTQ
ncbi:MAG: hypothetical protein ACR2FJ_03715 [Qipengyuania sp.]